VRIIELRNDLKAVVDAIGKALEGIYDPAIQRSSQVDSSSERPKPYAKVDGVAPGSPIYPSSKLTMLRCRPRLWTLKAFLVQILIFMLYEEQECG